MEEAARASPGGQICVSCEQWKDTGAFARSIDESEKRQLKKGRLAEERRRKNGVSSASSEVSTQRGVGRSSRFTHRHSVFLFLMPS